MGPASDDYSDVDDADEDPGQQYEDDYQDDELDSSPRIETDREQKLPEEASYEDSPRQKVPSPPMD